MSDTKYKAGDVVVLKAGGPKMVVEQYFSHGDHYKCTWFSGAKHNSERFKEEALEPYKEKLE